MAQFFGKRVTAAKLIPGLGYYYDIQKITGATVTTMSEGTFNVTPDVTMLVIP